MLPVSWVNAENSPSIHLVTEHLPPYQIEAKNKSLSGFAVDVIKATMKRSQYDYTLNSYSWSHSYKLAQAKANHCIFSLARTKSRETLFKWVGPIYYVNNTAMWALKTRTIQVENLNDVKKYTVAVSRDDMTHIGLIERGFKENEHLYVLDNTKSLVKLLLTRPGIDLIVANDMTIKFHTDLAGVTIDDLQRVYEIKNLPLNLFFACSKQTDDNIIKHLSKNLQSLYQDGSYDTILKKWRDQLLSPDF
ncbi:ABC transporter substrate-binding protein [Colwellia sp. MB3u-4]|uniref:substrate-binding periplasmic protein n=1 Tax=Colwellia sp. MB3u-4 TaxID=2759822 RepID=UPI0015F6B774|nr:transporter substrate-binding domain-containing protein [Colwellia sp. MB3u-4]MBA6287341.1 transporter substrate-binding domain-containing protein [Colwellia sp. MB3u-4]